MDQNGDSNSYATVGLVNPASDTGLVTGDFDNVTFTEQIDSGDRIDFVTEDQYADFPLNATGTSNISKVGISKFGLFIGNDFVNSAPTNENQQVDYTCYGAENSGTASDPKLVVEHSESTPPPSNSGGNIQSLSYVYDDVGNITRINDNSSTTLAAQYDYTYDDLYRLSTASTTNATSTPYYREFGYDSLGNIASSSVQGNYTYAETGYANPHAATSINGETLTYDNNGNLLSYASSTYEWDYRNRLASSSDGGLATSYGYDHTGERVIKTTGGVDTVTPNQYFEIEGATSTKYIYAGNELVAYIEADGTATSTYYVHPDHLGSTRVVTDAGAQVVQTLDYYPYGSLRIDNTTSPDTAKKYTGHTYDEETDLTYAGARYLDSSIGKWISMDPASRDNPNQFLRDPQQLNSYSYARNNPLILVDPTGEKAELSWRPVLGFSPNYGFHGAVIITNTPEDMAKLTNLRMSVMPDSDGLSRVTLGGNTDNFITGDLYARMNYGEDKRQATVGEGIRQQLYVPDQYNVDSIQFENELIGSFNGIQQSSSNLGKYSPMGAPYFNGQNNSGNTLTSILLNAGIKQSTIDYLKANAPKGTWGFGTALDVKKKEEKDNDN